MDYCYFARSESDGNGYACNVPILVFSGFNYFAKILNSESDYVNLSALKIY